MKVLQNKIKYRLNLQFFANRRDEVISPSERLRVESEVRTWFKDKQMNSEFFEKAVGDYIYTVRHDGYSDDNQKYMFTILNKRPIENKGNDRTNKRRNFLKINLKKGGRRK